MTTNTQSSTNVAERHDLSHPTEWLRDIPNPGTDVGAIAYGVIFLVAAWLTGRAVQIAIHRYLDKKESAGADATGIRFLGQLAKVGVYLFAFLFYTHIVPGLQHLGTAWLTSMGLVSVVVGLAAQSTLGNLISGISLVLYRPFNLGDQLQVTGPKGAEIGVVESINLGTTVLRTPDNRLLVIPNNTMASQVCVNLSAMRKGVPCNVVITVPSNADVPAARKILIDLTKDQPNTVTSAGCHVTAVSASGTELTLSAWCEDPNAAAQVKSDLLESAKRQLDAAGIKIV